MNLKILFLILVYYSIFSIVLILGGSIFSTTAGYSGSLELNQTGELTSGEVDQAGFFGSGISFGRFFSLITIGIGLPNTLPSWFIMLFAFWSTIITILTVGFVISSIWNG